MSKIIIQERYVLFKEHVHSVRYNPAESGTLAQGMSIYLPKVAIGKTTAPKSIQVTVKG